jgi:hypothetical protein
MRNRFLAIPIPAAWDRAADAGEDETGAKAGVAAESAAVPMAEGECAAGGGAARFKATADRIVVIHHRYRPVPIMCPYHSMDVPDGSMAFIGLSPVYA